MVWAPEPRGRRVGREHPNRDSAPNKDENARLSSDLATLHAIESLQSDVLRMSNFFSVSFIFVISWCDSIASCKMACWFKVFNSRLSSDLATLHATDSLQSHVLRMSVFSCVFYFFDHAVRQYCQLQNGSLI